MTQSLEYTPELAFAPIPPCELGLPTVTAEPWLKVADDFKQLEGLCFDRAGNLYFLEVFGGTIYKVAKGSSHPEVIFHAKDLNPAAIKIHKDGRLFICCLGDFQQGQIFSISPDGKNQTLVLNGYVADDMVFASDGSFYFTHFVGNTSHPTGCVYHVSQDLKIVTPILENLAGPNGVALSRDEKMLWVTETNSNKLNLIQLSSVTQIALYGTSVPYYFTGFHGPDSCCIDSEDNLYVAMYNQGRVLIFNKLGFPIGQVLIPGREKGHHLRTTHPMLIPGTRDLLICTNDYESGEGAWIFKAQAFAESHRGFQFHE